MSYVMVGVIALTAIALIFGTLWGMRRGRNRSILRLILIIGCVVGAIFLRPILVDIIMEIDTGDGTVAEMLASSLNQGEQALPASMQNLVVSLIEIIFGLLSYFILFFVLRFITWILIYPICKIFVKKEAKKKKGWGALIGLVQGLVVAFAVIVPLNGLAVQVNKLSQVKMDGKPMLEIPAEVGLGEYAESTTYTIYDTIGGWYFDMLTTAETKDGDKISLSGTCGVLISMADVGSSLGKVSSSMEELNKEGATDQEKYDALNDAGQALTETANKISKLDVNSQNLLNDILKEMFTSEDFQISLEYVNFNSMADFFTGFAEYVNKTKISIPSASVSQEEVDKIINGFARSDMLVDMFIGDGTETVGTLYQIEGLDSLKFATAINNNTDLSNLQKLSLLALFGISI